MNLFQSKRGTRTRLIQGSLAAAVCVLAFGCASDNIIGDDYHYMPKVSGGGGNYTGVPGEPNGCDMTGIWFAQLHTESEALGIATADAYNWFYYELEDNGDDVVITRSFDCSFVVCGVTNIQLTPTQAAVLSYYNRQDGQINADPNFPDDHVTVAPRKMTYALNDEGTCDFEMERWWSVRSAPNNTWPDRDSYSTATIGEIQSQRPLPPEPSKPVSPDPPTSTVPANQDWDEDGVTGIALQVDKPIAGARSAIQRDWNEVPLTTVVDGSVDFTVEAKFDNEESLYWTDQGLLQSGSTPRESGHSIRFVRIGDLGDESVTAPEDIDGFLSFCAEKRKEYFYKDPESYCKITKQKPNGGVHESGE